MQTGEKLIFVNNIRS